MRLARYLAHCGVASRRRAEELIAAGHVRVDGERVTDPARAVSEGDDVTVRGQPVAPEHHEYHLVNKPVGFVSTARDPGRRPKVTDLVRSSGRMYPVGRLDADSSGLILLTNDGELANRLMHPSFEVPKAYRAWVKGRVSERELRDMRAGLALEDGPTAPAKARIVRGDRNRTLLEITIHEGRKRQVRRMCEAVGHRVIELERVGFGPLRLGRLAPGRSRLLTPEEIDRLRRT